MPADHRANAYREGLEYQRQRPAEHLQSGATAHFSLTDP